jgi:hypothetical protein
VFLENTVGHDNYKSLNLQFQGLDIYMGVGYYRLWIDETVALQWQPMVEQSSATEKFIYFISSITITMSTKRDAAAVIITIFFVYSSISFQFILSDALCDLKYKSVAPARLCTTGMTLIFDAQPIL